MIPVLIDAAMRSLFVGLIVAVGLRAFRIRNVFAQKAALGLVLAGALAMPFLMPIADRLQLLPANASIVLPAHPMTLLEELQVRLQAKSGSVTQSKSVASPIPTPYSPHAERPSGSALDSASAPRAKEPRPSSSQAVSLQKEAGTVSANTVEETQPLAQHSHVAFSPASLALSIYLGVALLFLLRLGPWTGCNASSVAHRRADFHARTTRHSHRAPSPRQPQSLLTLDHRFCHPAARRLRYLGQREGSHRARSRTFAYSSG